MRSYINLRICGQGLNLQEITNKLGLLPVNARKKGEVHVDEKYSGKSKIFQEDFWIGEYRPSENVKLEDELEHFLVQLKPSAAYLKSLAEKHTVTVWVSSYLEKEQANVHISSTAIDVLSEIGATLDCSMAFLKDFYEGNY